MSPVTAPEAILAETISRLQAGGRCGEERVVLWLTRAVAAAPCPVTELFEPDQITAKDRFYLPPESMRALMAHLRTRRLKVAAQVHSHPGRAFHSEADDAWAIVRQHGALSLVLPDFALKTTTLTFHDHTKSYTLSPDNYWLEVETRKAVLTARGAL